MPAMTLWVAEGFVECARDKRGHDSEASLVIRLFFCRLSRVRRTQDKR